MSHKRWKWQFHHIFPTAIFNSTANTRETDNIANPAFSSGKAKRKLNAKTPALYVPQVQKANGEQPFESLCIPTNPVQLTVEPYRAFLSEQRQLIAERLPAWLQAHGAPLWQQSISTDPSRKVPTSIQEKIRQRCGFGRVIFGTCFHDYEHFDPDNADAVAHRPEQA